MIRIGIVAASMLVSTIAFAASEQYSATLATPLAAPQDFIINGNLFRCEGAACVITSAPNNASSLSVCRKLVRKVGAVLAYGTASAPYDAEKIAACNAK